MSDGYLSLVTTTESPWELIAEIRAAAHLPELPVLVVDRFLKEEYNKPHDKWYEYHLRFPGTPDEFVLRFAERFGGRWIDHE